MIALGFVVAASPLAAAQFSSQRTSARGAPALALPSPPSQAEIRERIDAVGGPDDHDADAVVVFQWTDVIVRPNGIGTARTHTVTKVLRDGGIRRQSVQVFPFDPNTNRLDLVAVRLYRKDGKVYEYPVARARIQPQAAGSIFWGTKQYMVPLPRLEVGDAVETISDMTGFNVAYLGSKAGEELNYYGEPLKPPVAGHWHDEVHFWTTGYPIAEKRYTVRIPIDKPLQYGVYNGELQTTVTMDAHHMTYSFVKEDMTPLKSEPSQQNWPSVAPKLLLATLPSWEDKGRWLYQVSEPQFEADEAIQRTVDEIIKDCKTDEEKYTALNHWVAENIRYAGTSRGMCEGYTIHRSVETFHDRCGVCKDKAGMLVTMLRCAGFDSFLVMTMARQRVDPIPADQFNHAVTCIRWDDGSLTLLDPTWMPKSRDNWSTLEPLQHVVYGLPEGKELSQSPDYPPETCQATWEARSRIDAENNLSGTLAFEAIGAPEGRIRRTLAGLHPRERQAFFDRTFQRLAPNARPQRVNFRDPVDFSGPLTISGDFVAERYVLGDNARRYLALPMMQTVFGDRALYDLWWDSSSETRDYGLKLLASRRALISETITLPPDWKTVELPDPVDLDGPAASLKFDVSAKGGQITYTCDLRVKKWMIPPEEYPNFREVMDQFDELAGLVVVCETEATHDE
jgi:hypothetical protein